jgi:hypothetical protein
VCGGATSPLTRVCVREVVGGLQWRVGGAWYIHRLVFVCKTAGLDYAVYSRHPVFPFILISTCAVFQPVTTHHTAGTGGSMVRCGDIPHRTCTCVTCDTNTAGKPVTCDQP